MFDGDAINPLTNRHLQDESFRSVPKMNELVAVFESKYTHLRVKSVWLIKKAKNNGGFQHSWHRDFYLGADIIAMIVINVGVCDMIDLISNNYIIYVYLVLLGANETRPTT